MTLCYLDASALVKLVTTESETAALRDYLASAESRATSRIATIEVSRALARKPAAERTGAEEAWRDATERLVLLEIDGRIAEAAAVLPPVNLRSLDAIHLASALALGDELDAFVTYDVRLADAARANRLPVVAPA